MRMFYCCTLGLFLLTVLAEKEDFQGYHTKQTKGTTVTKDLLLKNENTVGHGTEGIPTENTHQHTAVTVTARFPEGVLLDTRPKASYERTEVTKALAIIASTIGFVSRNGQKSQKSTRDNPSAMRIHAKSETPLISNYDKIVFPSPQAEYKSMMNGTSKPEVYLSRDAMKASPWLHTLLDNRNQRIADSITPTSADRGPGVPILSASQPRVIDNLTVLHNDNGDKQSQGTDDKGISNLGQNEYPLGTIQSIFGSDTAEDSVRGNTLTNLCLTCQKDRRAVSTEKSMALPALSPDGSSDSLSIDGLALNFSHFTSSLPSSHQQSVERQDEMLNKDISRIITKHSSFGVREQLVNNLTLPHLSLNKTVNHIQSILNNSQIKSFLSETRPVAFDTRAPAELSSATQNGTKKQSGHTFPSDLISTTSAFYRSSKSLYTLRKQETLGKKVSIGDPLSKLIYFSKHNKNASHSLSINFKNVFVQTQPLDLSSGSVSSTAHISEAPHSSQRSVLPEGSDHSAASNPTAIMRLVEDHSTIASFSHGRPTSFAVTHPESHSLTGRADPLISMFSQTPTKPNSNTKEPMWILLAKNSAIKFTSVTTKRHMTEKQDSQAFNTVNSIVKQYFVDPSGPAYEPKTETTTLTTRKVVVPVNVFLSESRQDFDDDMSTATTQLSKSFSERLTMSRLLGSQSKITQGRTFDVSSDNHVVPTRQSFVKYNRDLIQESLIDHNLKSGDKNEQELTEVAEDEDKEIIKAEGKHGGDIKGTKEILKLQKEEESSEDEKLGNIREGTFRPDETENRKQAKNNNSGVYIDQNTDREKDKIVEYESEQSTEDGAGMIREEDVTLRQHPRHGEGRDEEDADKRGVTKTIRNDSTKDVAKKQTVSLNKEGAETASKEDIKLNSEIVREVMTYVPLGPTTNSRDLNRDKGHTVTNLSSCLSLIKQMGAPEHKGDNTAQIAEMKNKPFSYKVTSNNRPLHSTLRSQSPELSRITHLPKEPYTQILPHLSTHSAMLTKYASTSSLTKEMTPKVVKATNMVPKLSQEFSTLKFSNALKPTISPQSSATRSTHTVLKSVSNMPSLTSPRLATTAEVLRAQSQFTRKSSTRSVSIIYSISDHKHKFSTSISKLLQTPKAKVQAEHIKPAHILDCSVKDPFISNMIGKVKTSTSVNPAPTKQMYNDDSSTRPPTAVALSSVVHTSIDRRQQNQSATQTSQSASSSFDMTSDQPCSFKRSEQTAHSDALHALVDDNKQRSVQALMALTSPKAKNDQFPLSSMSPLPNLPLLGDDSLPGTYGLTGLTRSAAEKEILRANAGTVYANIVSGHAESLLGKADKKIQTEENESVQRMVNSGVKHVTKQKAESRDEKSSSPSIDQTTGRSKYHAIYTEEFNSLFILQTEKLVGKNSHNHTDLFNVDGNDDENNTVKTSLENNHRSQLENDNETSTQSIMSAIQTTHNIEQAINEDFVTNDFAVTVLDTNDPTLTTAFIESDEIPQIQANDSSDMESHAAQTTEKQLGSTTPRGAPPVPHIHFGSDLKARNISTQQLADRIINVNSEFQITTSKTNDLVSLAPTASASLIVSTEVHESALTTSEDLQVVTEKSSQQYAHAEHMLQSNSHTEPLSLREPPTTATTGQLPPAVKRRNTTETQSVKQSEHEIFDHVSEQNQHAPPGMIAVTHCCNDPGQSIQAGLLKSANRSGEPHDEGVESSLFKDIKTTLRTKMAFEAKHPVHKVTPRVHTLDGADQHKKQAVPEKTLITQVMLGAVTESVPPAGISPSEFIIKTSCRTIDCKSSETTGTTIGPGETDHTGREKLSGNTDRFNAVHLPDTKTENGNSSTDYPVPEKATPHASNLHSAALSPATRKSDHDQATVDKTTTRNAKSVTDEVSTRLWRVLVESDHLERLGELEQPRSVEKTTQRHSHSLTSNVQEAAAIEVTLSEPEETTAQTTVKTTEWTLLTEKKQKTKLNRGAAQAEKFEAQNATRSARAVAKEETAVQESGHRLLLPEPESESELPRQKQRRRTSPHLYLSGVTEVSDDLCGSGNYTAEMSVNLGSEVEPGDAVPALGNLKVIINLKTNNSRINLKVTSCCLSPTIKPDITNSTCCLFSRLAAEPAWITLLPSALSTSASFTISLFQMINYSVVYLHCDLSVCLRNRSHCERQCHAQKSTFSSEGPEAADSNHRNRISFGPMLREVKNSTFPGEIDPSELDLILVIVSLLVGSTIATVTLLLVWLAYRRRTIWLLHSAASPRACCGCLHPGGDLILP